MLKYFINYIAWYDTLISLLKRFDLTLLCVESTSKGDMV